MANLEVARANLAQYVKDYNTKHRRIKIYLSEQDGALTLVHIRTNGFCLSQAAFMGEDVQKWSHCTMYITSANPDVGIIEIAVSSNRINYSPDLVVHTLRNLLGDDE